MYILRVTLRQVRQVRQAVFIKLTRGRASLRFANVPARPRAHMLKLLDVPDVKPEKTRIKIDFLGGHLGALGQPVLKLLRAHAGRNVYSLPARA